MKCKGHRRDGKQCRKDSILGGTVCRMHGGAAPQVKTKAIERLAALVDPAILRLSQLLQAKNEHVALGAVKDVLDRGGHKPTERIEQLNYTPEDVEMLSVLDEKELDQYIELRRKVTQGHPTTGSGFAENPDESGEALS